MVVGPGQRQPGNGIKSGMLQQRSQVVELICVIEASIIMDCSTIRFPEWGPGRQVTSNWLDIELRKLHLTSTSNRG